MKLERRKKSNSIIPLSSMADIAFLLLIFFMLSSIAEMEKEIPLNLPEARVSVSETEKYFNIWINKKGELFFNNKKSDLKNLVSFASFKLGQNLAVKALIRADREIPFEYINNVMEVLNDTGIYNIVLVSKRQK